MNEKEYRVDADTERKLDDIKTDLHKTIVDQIKEEFKAVKEYVSELFGKDIERIDKEISQSNLKHTEHYNDNEKRRDEIYSIKESLDHRVHTVVDDKFTLIDTRIESLKDAQIKLITQNEAKDETKNRMKEQQYKEEETNDRRKNTIIALIIGIFTIFTTLVGAIFYLATKII